MFAIAGLFLRPTDPGWVLTMLFYLALAVSGVVKGQLGRIPTVFLPFILALPFLLAAIATQRFDSVFAQIGVSVAIVATAGFVLWKMLSRPRSTATEEDQRWG